MRLPSWRFLAVTGVSALTLLGGAVALADRGAITARAGGSPPPTDPTATTEVDAGPTTVDPTTEVTAPATTTVDAPPGLAEGGTQAVSDLQVRLAELGYDIDQPDGRYGERTRFAVMAFQKIERLAADGAAGPRTMAALAVASPPRPVVPGAAATRIEVDLDRQVLLLWKAGRLARVLPVSTGNAQWYCVEGDCDVATTPTGTFRIGRKHPGLEVSRLGELYNPMYFYLGWAIHGSPSVPAYPASHGCVRIPMYASASLFAQVPAGTPVHVVGQNPPVGPAPPEATSTTTRPTATPTTTPAGPGGSGGGITVPTTTSTTTTTVVATTTTVPPTTTTTIEPEPPPVVASDP